MFSEERGRSKERSRNAGALRASTAAFPFPEGWTGCGVQKQKLESSPSSF
jgi:hypothetical protein